MGKRKTVAASRCLRSISELEWEHHTIQGTMDVEFVEVINAGSLQRIADALERLVELEEAKPKAAENPGPKGSFPDIETRFTNRGQPRRT